MYIKTVKGKQEEYFLVKILHSNTKELSRGQVTEMSEMQKKKNQQETDKMNLINLRSTGALIYLSCGRSQTGRFLSFSDFTSTSANQLLHIHHTHTHTHEKEVNVFEQLTARK